jgi:hypothetical protein
MQRARGDKGKAMTGPDKEQAGACGNLAIIKGDFAMTSIRNIVFKS